VIGAGLAGCAYALQAAHEGLQVDLLSLEGPLAANSDGRRAGSFTTSRSDPEELARGHCGGERWDRQSRRGWPSSCAKDRRRLKELLIDELAVGFDRDAAGKLDFTREGGHTARRIIPHEGQ